MIKEYLAYLRDNPEGYWFKRKLFGWGWTPARWQGWVTLIVFAVLIAWDIGRVSASSGGDTLLGVAPSTIILLMLLIVICYRKGEKPRWQWGIPEKYKKPE
jgi:hypothetical protein